MNENKIGLRILSISLFLVFLVISCIKLSQTFPEPSYEVSGAVYATSTPERPYAILNTKIPITPHIPLSTKTQTSTLTIVPTLSPDQIDKMVLSLLKDNGGCKLPCWWGIEPGKTRWKEARAFLTQLDPNIYAPGEMEQAFVAYSTIPVSESISDMKGVRLELEVRDGIIQSIKVHSIEKSNSFQVARLLSLYGQPEEIRLFTFSSFAGGEPPISLFVYYPKQGILAQYNTVGELQNGMIRGCLSGSPRFGLWFPEHEISFLEGLKKSGFDFLQIPLGISEASNLTEQEFYKAFRDEGSLPCVETPKNLWLGVFGETPSP